MPVRYRLGLAVAIAIAALALPLWWARAPALDVAVATVARAPLRMIVATNATVEPIADFEVRARLDGRVVEAPKAGARVDAGDMLVRIDATPVAAELEAARSQQLEAEESLRAARTQRERAERSFALDQKLFREHALTEDRLAEVRADRDEARARSEFLEREVPVRLAALELRIAELRAQLAGAEVRAPFAGTIYRADVDVDEVVRHGQRLLAMGDLERLQIRANIDQVDLGKMRPENRITVTANAFPERSWHGRIDEIVPYIELRQNRAVAEAIGTIDPPVDGLVPGMNVDVEILVREEPDVLQVPSRAIFAAGTGPFVYRIDGSRVVATPVRLGLSSFTAVEIVAGVPAGADVVLGPVADLRDGMRVAVRREPNGQP